MKIRLKLIAILCVVTCIISSALKTDYNVLYFAQQIKNDDLMDVYLLVGQSNMAGRGIVTDSTSECGILSLNKNDEWVAARDPLHFDKSEAGVGPGLSFAREIKQLSQKRCIGLVPCAVGGTSISKWKPDAYDKATNTHPYNDMINRLKIALKSGTLKGILWHQGESDSQNGNYKLYEVRFDSLLNNISKEIGININDIPVIVGEVGRFFILKQPPNESGKINEVLNVIAAKHRNIFCVSSEGLTDRGDSLHFNVSSAKELGRRYAKAYIMISERLKKTVK